jgi:hypothetical protein
MENITQGQWFRGPSADLGDEISQSLRFSNNGAAATKYLTNSSINWLGDQTYTISYWLKKSFSNTSSMWIDPFNNDTSAGGTPGAAIHHSASGGLSMYSGSSFARGYTGSPVFRDPNAWYHFVHSRNASGWQTWVNGVSLGTADIADSDGAGGTKIMNPWGGGQSQSSAYLAEYHIVDGQYLQPTSFGRYNEDQVWVPKTYADNGTTSHGTNGFHLTFDSSQTNGIGHDSSGNGNHFTATGFDTTAISSANRLNDIDIKDTPTSNYAHFNALWDHTTPGLEGGNMVLNTAQTITGQASFRFPVGTTGKYWVEAGTDNLGSTTNAPALCITDQLDAAGLSNTAWSTTANYSSIGGYQASYSNFTSTSATSYTTVGGQVGMAIDFDNQEVKMYNNSTLINTDTTVDFTKELAITVMQPTTSYNTYDPYLNAGQQAFIQTVPTGFKELQTNNLPEPTVKNGADHFEAVEYTGTSSGTKAITSLEFQPDLIWFKSKSHGTEHALFDSLRGASAGFLDSSNSTGQATSNAVLSSFDSNGFTVGAPSSVEWNNGGGRTYMAWCWKAGGAPTATNSAAAGSAQTAGSVKVDGANGSFAQGTIAVNKMSVNTTAGFSIVQYTGTGSAGSIPHGLGAVPEMAIFKRYDGTASWAVYHQGLDGNATRDILLDQGSSQQSASTAFWNDTLPTSTLFTIGAGGNNNTNGEGMIAYLWTPIPGYSRFGRYTGNGNSGDNGTFVYTGFKPRFIMLRVYSQSGNWMMWDTERSKINPVQNRILANTATEEQSYASQEVDIVSNGFKLRGADSDVNETYDYIYMAFASNPFGGKNQPPAPAR